MPEKLHPLIEYLLSYENKWCTVMDIYNPYGDPWPCLLYTSPSPRD